MYRFRTPTDIRQTHNAAIAGTIFLTRSGSHSGRTGCWILMKFSTNASSTSTNDRAKFRPNLMFRFRMPTDIRQTHNATIAGTPSIAGLPPIAGTIFLTRYGSHSGRTGCWILMKFGTNASSTSSNKRTKFHPNLMYRFRTPTDIRQTHNATIAGLPPIAGTIFLTRSGSHSGRTGCWILMKFGTNASSTSTNNRTKFHTNLMYRFRTPTDIRQTHNATIAGTIFLTRSGSHSGRTGCWILMKFGTNA